MAEQHVLDEPSCSQCAVRVATAARTKFSPLQSTSPSAHQKRAFVMRAQTHKSKKRESQARCAVTNTRTAHGEQLNDPPSRGKKHTYGSLLRS